MTQDADVPTMTYEQALGELDTLIERLERGDVPLADAIRCYERGSALARHCAGLLDQTEAAVTQLVVAPGGRAEERPMAAAEPTAVDEPTSPGSVQDSAAGTAAARRTGAPPPPSALRARSTTAPARTPAPALFPGMEPPAPTPRDDPGFDLDDIPF